jgi:heme/copper-type cytochrome/quinol oxidase subunit 2
VAGVVIIVLVLVIVLPIVFIVSGLLVAIVLGMALRRNGEETHEGSELIELNQ